MFVSFDLIIRLDFVYDLLDLHAASDMHKVNYIENAYHNKKFSCSNCQS